MRSIQAWARLMSSTLTVAPYAGKDGYGKPVFGTAVTYRAHLSRKPRLVLTQTGQQIISNMSAYLASADPILPTAQVTLSTSDVGSTEAVQLHPPIQSVDRRFDQTRPHHTTLVF